MSSATLNEQTIRALDVPAPLHLPSPSPSVCSRGSRGSRISVCSTESKESKVTQISLSPSRASKGRRSSPKSSSAKLRRSNTMPAPKSAVEGGSRPTWPQPPAGKTKKAGSKAKSSAAAAAAAAVAAEEAKFKNTDRRSSHNDDPNVGISNLRNFLSERFGGLEEAFAAMDCFGTGKINFGDLQATLEQLNASAWEATGGVDLLQVFKELDYNESMELNFFKLMECDEATRLKKKAKLQLQAMKSKDKKKKKPGAVLEDKPEADQSPQPPRRGRVFEMEDQASAWPPVTWVAPESEWMRKIAEFGKDSTLDELNLEYGFIGERGIGQLIDALNSLPGMRTMSKLQLFGNYIGSIGTIALADALERRVSLQRINLGKNGIGDDGAIRLAEMVLKIDVLEELLLARNRIGDRGAAQLADAISKRPLSLAKLDLSHNSICEKGMRVFVDAFGIHRIPELLLQGNIADVPDFPEPVIEEDPDDIYGLPVPIAQRRDSPVPSAGPSPRPLRRAHSKSGAALSSPQHKLDPFGPPGSSPWTCDIAHKLKPKAKKAPVSPQWCRCDTPELRIAARAGSYVPGSLPDAWPAAKGLSKALQDATLYGQGKLWRPASQGSLTTDSALRRQGEGGLSSDDPWGQHQRPNSFGRSGNFGGSPEELQGRFGRVHTIKMRA